MPNKQFIENYPLYKKFEVEILSTMDKIDKPSVNFHCSECGSRQTYVMTNEYHYASGIVNTNSLAYNLRCTYLCIGCQRSQREFFIYVSPDRDWIMKIGQYPAWEIQGDKGIERMLGAHRGYLSRGLICESQGYGIGAFSYYRRITEEIIDQLLEDVRDLIPEDEREAFNEVLAKVKSTRQTSEKINLIKDMLPSSLLIDGMNPLGILHAALSKGLHAESDEECLVHAETVRESVVFLTSQISENKKSKAAFSDKMRKLLEKKK